MQIQTNKVQRHNTKTSRTHPSSRGNNAKIHERFIYLVHEKGVSIILIVSSCQKRILLVLLQADYVIGNP